MWQGLPENIRQAQIKFSVKNPPAYFNVMSKTKKKGLFIEEQATAFSLNYLDKNEFYNIGANALAYFWQTNALKEWQMEKINF